MGRELPSPPYLKREALQLWKDERLGRKTLSLPLLNADMKSMLTESRGDAPRLMGRAPVKQDVAWAGPTTTARRTRQLKHAQIGNPPLPQAGQQNDPTTEPFPRGDPTSHPGQMNGPGKATSQRLLKDKHLWFLVFTLKFTSELPTPASAGIRISLGGCQGCLPV